MNLAKTKINVNRNYKVWQELQTESSVVSQEK